MLTGMKFTEMLEAHRVREYSVSSVQSFDSFDHMNIPPDKMAQIIKENLARMLARELMEHGPLDVETRTNLGRVSSLRGFWTGYEGMRDLLQAAYMAGLLAGRDATRDFRTERVRAAQAKP